MRQGLWVSEDRGTFLVNVDERVGLARFPTLLAALLFVVERQNRYPLALGPAPTH